MRLARLEATSRDLATGSRFLAAVEKSPMLRAKGPLGSVLCLLLAGAELGEKSAKDSVIHRLH